MSDGNETFDPGYIPPGAMVGAYEVQTRIAQGGFGALYRVVRNGKLYALKVALRPEGTTSAENARLDERAAREVAMLQCLRHPNIVRVHAFDRWPDLETGFPYLVMEFVEGVRLRDWQRRTEPSAASVAVVFQKLALALAEMHSRGISHRDLKSENVLVRPDGEPIIVDFGISRLRDAAPVTQCDSLLGTYTHFSPEYCRFFLDARYEKGERFTQWDSSDLHALGVMLYEALAGRPPFERAVAKEETSNPAAAPFAFMQLIAEQIPRRPREWNARVPEALDALCMRLLQKEPADRFKDAAELAAAISDAMKAPGEDWMAPLLSAQAGAAKARAEVAAAQPSPTVEISELLIPSSDLLSANGSPPAARVDAPPIPAREQETRDMPAQGHARGDDRQFSGAANGELEVPADAVPPVGPTGDQLPSALVRARDEVRAAIAAGDRNARRRWLPVALLGAPIALVLGLILIGATSEGPEPREPIPPEDAFSAPEPSAAVRRDEPPSPFEPASDETAGPEPRRAAQATTHALARAEVDALLAQQYGAPLPASPHAAKAPAARPEGDRPGWLRRARAVERLAVAEPPSADAPALHPALPSLAVPFGTLLSARLSVDLDSNALDGPVEAVVTRGHAGAPRGTRLFGRASVSGDRFRIEFDRAIRADTAVERCRALAVESGRRTPGLRAHVQNAQPAQPSPGIAHAIAQRTASLVLGQADASLPQQAARIAGESALEGPPRTTLTRHDRLSLPRGTTFDVFIEGDG